MTYQHPHENNNKKYDKYYEKYAENAAAESAGPSLILGAQYVSVFPLSRIIMLEPQINLPSL